MIKAKGGHWSERETTALHYSHRRDWKHPGRSRASGKRCVYHGQDAEENGTGLQCPLIPADPGGVEDNSGGIGSAGNYGGNC